MYVEPEMCHFFLHLQSENGYQIMLDLALLFQAGQNDVQVCLLLEENEPVGSDTIVQIIDDRQWIRIFSHQ